MTGMTYAQRINAKHEADSRLWRGVLDMRCQLEAEHAMVIDAKELSSARKDWKMAAFWDGRAHQISAMLTSLHAIIHDYAVDLQRITDPQ